MKRLPRIEWEGDLGGRLEGTDGRARAFLAARDGERVWLRLAGWTYRIDPPRAEERPRRAAAGGVPKGEAQLEPSAPIPGKVSRVAVEPGEKVEPGDLLVAISAMKMEHEVRAELRGTVAQVHVAEGARVEAGDPLVRIAPG